MNQAQQIATEITNQLGGTRILSIMAGAKNFMTTKDSDGVTFKFMKGNKKINGVTIKLNSMDTYDVEFKQLTRKKDKEYGVFMPHINIISKHTGIYCDMLKRLFESETGLYLSL